MVNKLKKDTYYTFIASELEQNAILLRKTGVFYCENRDDAVFWTKILKFYAPNLDFEPQYATITPNGNESRGSGQVFNYLHYSNANFLLFTDSDYHFLLDDIRIDTPFLAHTFTYAIENHWCYAPNIKPFLETKYEVKIDFDFELFLETFSKIIYKAFIYNVLDRKNGSNHFSIYELEQLLRFADFSINNNANDYLTHIKSVLEIKTNDLKTKFSQTDFDALEQSLITQKGLTPETTYLYLRGHTIYEKVLQPILRQLKAQILDKTIAVLPNEEKEKFRKKLDKFTDLSRNISFLGYLQIESIFDLMQEKGFRKS
jgi:hypothetical protein